MSRACKTHKQALFVTLKTKSLRQTFSCQVLKEFAKKPTPTHLLELMTSMEFSPPSTYSSPNPLLSHTHTFSLSLSLLSRSTSLDMSFTYLPPKFTLLLFIHKTFGLFSFLGVIFFFHKTHFLGVKNSHPPLTPGELSNNLTRKHHQKIPFLLSY